MEEAGERREEKRKGLGYIVRQEEGGREKRRRRVTHLDGSSESKADTRVATTCFNQRISRFDQAQLLARSCLNGLDTILDFIDIGMEPIIALSESEILLLQFVDGVPQVDQVDDIALPKPQGVLQSGDKPD